MALKTFTMHLYWDDISHEYELYAAKSMNSRFLLYVGPVEVEALVPEKFDVRAAKLAAIKTEETRLRAEFQARITELQRQASELLALENCVDAS